MLKYAPGLQKQRDQQGPLSGMYPYKEPTAVKFTVYQMMRYGPIGPPALNGWRFILLEVGVITAPDEVTAVAHAREAGYVAPIIGRG